MKAIRFAFLILFAMFLTSCAGGGGGNSNVGGGGNQPPPNSPPSPPPEAPTVSLSVSAASIFVGESVTLAWSSTNASACTASGDWSGAKMLNFGESITPTSAGEKNYTLSCTGLGGTTVASVRVTVTPPQKPTIRISPASVDMTIGETRDFMITVTGSPKPTLSCVHPDIGETDINGTTLIASYKASTAVVLERFTTQLTCSATNSAGMDSFTAVINLFYPLPVITSVVEINGEVEDTALFCLRDISCFIRIFAVRGSGFYPGASVHASYFGDVPLPSGFRTGPNEILLFMPFDTPHFSPGDMDFQVASPSGEKSNVYKFPFLGGQNTLARLSDGYALINQGFPIKVIDQVFQTPRLHIFDSAVNKMRDFEAENPEHSQQVHVTGIAVTRVAVFGVLTDMILAPQAVHILLWDPLGGYHGFAGFSFEENGRPGGVAAKGNWGCVTEEFQNLLTCFEVFHGVPPIVSAAVGSFPAYIAMTDLPSPNASTTVAVVLNLGEGALAVFDVPSLSVVRYIDLPGFTTHSQLPAPGRGGGWHLAILEYDINLPGLPLLPVRVASVISRFDKKVWFVDLPTGQVSGPFSLDGEAFRIVADNVNRNFVIAVVNEDREVGGTRFVKIDPTGTITVPTNDKIDILAVGLQVSLDGSTRVSCERAVCKSQPND